MNKKTLRSKINMCMIILLFMLVSCQSIKQEQELSYQVGNPKEDNVFLEEGAENACTDYGYKMLYGKWSVEKKVGENYRLDVQDISDVIGKMFVFSREKVNLYYCDQEIEINHPEYEIVIIPLDKQTVYFPYMPTMNEMGINGNYVTIFSIDGYDIYFILKDDESLIMFYKDAYLELKRIEHEDGYESFYHAL